MIRFAAAGLCGLALLLSFVSGAQKAPAAPVSNLQPELRLPVFPGVLQDFLTQHLRYPDAAREAEMQGTVTIDFVVGKDGRAAQHKVVLSSGSPDLDSEALRLARAMPRWKPASFRGRKVAMHSRFTIRFSIQ